MLDLAKAVGAKHRLTAPTSSVYGRNEAMAFSQSHLFALPMTMFCFFTLAPDIHA